MQWPGKEFQLLGAISNAKPSAIFRLRNNNSSASSSSIPKPSGSYDIDMAMDESTEPSVTIALGISIEPASQVEAQLGALHGGSSFTSTSATTALALSRPVPPPVTLLAQRLLRNLFNYLTSFASTDGQSVPLKAFEAWYQKLQHKLAQDPTFLEKEDLE